MRRLLVVLCTFGTIFAFTHDNTLVSAMPIAPLVDITPRMWTPWVVPKPGQESIQKQEPTLKQQSAPTPRISEEDRYWLARVCYNETRSARDTLDARFAVVHTVLARVRANRADFGGNTVRGVALYPRQYSGLRDRLGWKPRELGQWEVCLNVAERALLGEGIPTGRMSEAFFYLEPNNSGLRSKCWFEKDLWPVEWHGTHLYHVEPTPQEKQVLKVVQHPACEKLARYKKQR